MLRIFKVIPFLLFIIMSMFSCNKRVVNPPAIYEKSISKDLITGDWILSKILQYDSLNNFIADKSYNTAKCPTYMTITIDKIRYSVGMNCETDIDSMCFQDTAYLYEIPDTHHIEFGGSLKKAYFYNDTLVIENLQISISEGQYIIKRFYNSTESFHDKIANKCTK